MKAVVAAAVAILGAGLATSATADGDDAGGGMPVIAADSDSPSSGWGVASSAGLTYADAPGAPGGVVDASDGQDISQNYQFLDPNVLEYTQQVAGGTVVTLSGVLLQRDGDDSDTAQLDEVASGVYSAGSAALVPSVYDAASMVVASSESAVSCTSSCDLLQGAGGATGAVKTLSSYASSVSSSLQSSNPFGDLGYSPGSYSGSGYYFPPTPPVIIIPPTIGGGGGGLGGGDPSGGLGGGDGGQPPTQPPPIVGPGGGGNGGIGLPFAVPEPGAWVLMLIGVGAIGAVRRRRAAGQTSA